MTLNELARFYSKKNIQTDKQFIKNYKMVKPKGKNDLFRARYYCKYREPLDAKKEKNFYNEIVAKSKKVPAPWKY